MTPWWYLKSPHGSDSTLPAKTNSLQDWRTVSCIKLWVILQTFSLTFSFSSLKYTQLKSLSHVRIRGRFVILLSFGEGRRLSLCTDNNGVFTGVFSCWHAACEEAGRAAYSQLCLHVTGEYNHQQACISSQTIEYVARHPVNTQRVHLYFRTRSQKLEISSV